MPATDYGTYPVSQTDPLLNETTWGYDYTFGVPISETDPNGNETTAFYDSFGRMTKLVRPGDLNYRPTIKISYYDEDPFWTEISQRITGNTYFTIQRHYDGIGRQDFVVTGTGTTIDGDFSMFNQVDYDYAYTGTALTPSTTSQSMPYDPDTEVPVYTVTTNDILGRPTKIVAPDGTQTSYAYDGLLTTVTDANGNATTTQADVWGRTTKATPPTGPAVTYAYDPLDRLTSATRAGNTTSLTYNALGQKLSMSDPDMGYWTYTYNALGLLKTQTDARSCILTMSYDPINRLTDKVSSGAGCGIQVHTSYTYDEGNNGIGRRTGMSDASSTTEWLYDARGRMTEETKTISGNTFNTRWSYNSADLPVSMTYPDGEVVNYGYNDRMLLDSVIGDDIYVQSISYDRTGRMTQRVLGNDILTQTYTYFGWAVQGGRLQQLSTTRPSDQTTLQNLAYAYDPVGNILSITDTLAGPQTQTFTYDDLDRLTSASATGGTDGLYSESYTYDASTGNLAIKDSVTYTYSASHKHAVESLSNGNSYQYDANGNMTLRNVNGQTFTLAYDAENRLVSVSGAVTASFVYDGDGKQVKATVDDLTTTYAGQHYQVSGANVTKYYFAGAARVAVKTNGVLNYLLGDHLGSASLTTDANGFETAELRYKAWGETRFASGDMPTDYKFTGQRQEAALGLYFFNARWLDVSTGRFIQADTIILSPGNSQAWDRFAYVLNSPLL